jgi:protein involved in polysaccharide export with SLBB domain
LAAAGCAGTPLSGPDAGALPAPSARPTQTEYLIQPGDTLTLKFYYHPDHDQDVVVRQDGKLLLPLVGEVQAAGVTPARLAEQLAEQYSKNLRDPRVSVAVKASTQKGVFVGGEVARPGHVPYRPGLTVVQAIMEAGGPKDTARVDQVVFLQRVREDQYQATKIDLAKTLETGQTDADPSLGPSDVIFVPKSTIAKMNLFVQQYILGLLPVRPGIGISVVPGL